MSTISNERNVSPQVGTTPPKRSHRWRWIILGTLAILIISGLGWYYYNFHASIRPVHLSQQETDVVSAKIKAVESAGVGKPTDKGQPAEATGNPAEKPATEDSSSPETYSYDLSKNRPEEIEPKDKRIIVLSQREINGMLNLNTDLGERLKINLGDGEINLQYVQPIGEDVAIIGGQRWRFSMDLAINKGRGEGLELRLKDLSVGGIPLPSAWLEMVGITKNEDLVALIKKEMPGFAQFEKGIDYVDISTGELKIRLAE